MRSRARGGSGQNRGPRGYGRPCIRRSACGTRSRNFPIGAKRRPRAMRERCFREISAQTRPDRAWPVSESRRVSRSPRPGKPQTPTSPAGRLSRGSCTFRPSRSSSVQRPEPGPPDGPVVLRQYLPFASRLHAIRRPKEEGNRSGPRKVFSLPSSPRFLCSYTAPVFPTAKRPRNTDIR